MANPLESCDRGRGLRRLGWTAERASAVPADASGRTGLRREFVDLSRSARTTSYQNRATLTRSTSVVPAGSLVHTIVHGTYRLGFWLTPDWSQTATYGAYQKVHRASTLPSCDAFDARNGLSSDPV